jgi:drug/metabolite transporter (DMT)-like permease
VWCTKAASRVSSSTTNVILATESIFAAAIAFVVLGERLGPCGFIGASLLAAGGIVAGIAEPAEETLCVSSPQPQCVTSAERNFDSP